MCWCLTQVADFRNFTILPSIIKLLNNSDNLSARNSFYTQTAFDLSYNYSNVSNHLTKNN
ncbi:hypothetical protein BpHYR1_035392 [Brachionus plicatilis]|uniref:Uncharacterized protein n=1 Tax=Brachionus plicatilis TaxID=10195 RepID=A0A3M7SDT0_BRAPC|nr:hypothetical protein BpHYR1_035392 [Brachionus plicatilis]